MFLEKLVAQGAPFLLCGMNAEETLQQITDVSNEGRFLENIIVVEVSSAAGELKFAALPLMTWGTHEVQEDTGKRKGTKKKVVFQPDTARGLALPFVKPGSGNPLVPQGRYGVPVYPTYPKSFAVLLDLSEAYGFISGRLDKTMNLPVKLDENALNEVAKLIAGLAGQVQSKVAAKENQGHGLIAIVFPEAGGPYRYMDKAPVIGDGEYVLVGESALYPGRYIVARLDLLEKNFWGSKMAEGQERGQRESCSICGKNEESVSPYCKAWNWLSYTWDCPLSEKHRRKEPDLAGAVGALCRDCYSALVVGAGIFDELSAPLPYRLTKELFMPVASAGGREAAKKSVSRPPGILGCAMILPFRKDVVTADGGEILKEALNVFRSKNIRKHRNDRSLAAITGFEAVLPDDFNKDDYRLIIIYYQKSQADVQLRAIIEDVLPSTVNQLADNIHVVADEAAEIKRRIAETGQDFTAENYRSLIYLLIRAYGGGYLWHTLRSILNRRPVSRERFVKGAVLRLNGYAVVQNEDTAFWNLREEVAFYLAFHRFLSLYNTIILEGGNVVYDWRQMLDKAAKTPPEQLSFENVEELGFAAGFLTRRFSRWYWHNTGGSREKGTKGKDFVKHRVMSFGSRLTPDMVWRKALSRFQEYAVKLDMNLTEDFRRRAGVVESEYRRLREQVERKRDEFVGSFWSGYMLAPEFVKEEDANNNLDNKEE